MTISKHSQDGTALALVGHTGDGSASETTVAWFQVHTCRRTLHHI